MILISPIGIAGAVACAAIAIVGITIILVKNFRMKK